MFTRICNMWLHLKHFLIFSSPPFCGLSHSYGSAFFFSFPFSLSFQKQYYLCDCTLGRRLSAHTLLGAGWPLRDTLLCSTGSPLTEINLLNSPHSQPARPAGRRGHRAAESPLKLSLSFVICLPLLLFLSFSYHLSLTCLTLSCASHSLSSPLSSYFFLYSVSFCSPCWIFLFMRALGLLCYLL